MRNSILSVFFLFVSVVIVAQNRDLNYYITEAKANSPLLNKNKNESKLIQLDLKQMHAMLSKPSVDVNARVLFGPIIAHDENSNRLEWVSEGAQDYTGYDQAFTDGGQYQAMLSINQALFNKSIYHAASQKASIETRSSQNFRSLSKHEIEQVVSHQYLRCLKSEKQTEISRELLSEMAKQMETLQKLVEHAIYKQTDLLLLSVEFKNYELQYKSYQSNFALDLADLNLLCGIEDTTQVNLQDTLFGIIPDTLLQSQFLTSYRLDSLRIDANLTLFEQRYKPRLNVFADAGMNAIYLPAFNRFGLSTGLGFSWNIFDGNQRKIMHDKANIQMQTNAFNKQNFMTRHAINKSKYLMRMASVKQQIALTVSQLADYANLLNVYQQELAQQQISIMDFKNLFQDIASKKQESLSLEMELQALISSYNYWIY